MDEVKGAAAVIENETSAVGQAGPTAAQGMPAPGGGAQKKRRKKKKTVKIIVTVVVLLAVVGGITFGLIKLFAEKEDKKEILRDVVRRGSIQSTVTGSGVTKPKESETITLTSSGTVLEVYVKEGDKIKKGDPLYSIDSTEALAAVDSAQKTVDNYKKQLKTLLEAKNYLSVTADFGGILIDAADINVGDTVATGTKLGTLVDDKKMKLVLYFNYAYQNDIKKGQEAAVSIPSTMSVISGAVTEINYVKRVTPEGSKLFQVVITVDNPGILTADMGATAVLKNQDGEDIYPYEAGKLTYNRSVDVITKTGGKATVVNLLSYAQYDPGDLLLRMDGEDNASEIAGLENQLKTAEEALAKAQKNLANFNPVSPMDGTVLYCTLVPGEQVESGRAAISIADTSVMTVEVQVDAINIAYVKAGMPITITQWSRNGQQDFMGFVDSVSMEGKYENGYSYFPAVVRVDNPNGELMSGMFVDYSLVASQSDDTLLVPVQAVQYTDIGTLLFIDSETKPENAVDPETLNIEVPEGFYAVPVKVGLSDNSFAEILEGVAEGTVVFTQYMTERGYSDMGMGGRVMITRG